MKSRQFRTDAGPHQCLRDKPRREGAHERDQGGNGQRRRKEARKEYVPSNKGMNSFKDSR